MMKYIKLLIIFLLLKHNPLCAQDTALAKNYLAKAQSFHYSYNPKSRDSALFYYNKAIKENPRFDRAYYGRAILNSKIPGDRSAITDLGQAIKYSPKPVYYYERSLAYSRMKDTINAFKDADMAIKADAANMDYRVWRSTLFTMSNRKDKALEDDLFIHKNRESYLTNYMLAEDYYALGELSKALTHVNKAAETWPAGSSMFSPKNNGKPYLLRGKINFAAKKYKDAVNDYTKYFNWDMPNKTIEALKLRAEAYSKLGDKTNAAIDITEYEKLKAQGGK